MAYVPGIKSPLLKSASQHSSYNYTIRLDFFDFFPSIKCDDLKKQLEQIYLLRPQDEQLLEKILFRSRSSQHYVLPVGAPTSPVISNIVMRDLDSAFHALSKEIDVKSAITRYADDLYFSTNTKGVCADFHHAVQMLLNEFENPKLTLNERKTLFLSRGTKRVVNGLFVTPDGRVTIGREQKNKIKKLLYKISIEQITDEEFQSAKGLLAFIKDCEPEFYQRLAIKYGKSFFDLIKEKR